MTDTKVVDIRGKTEKERHTERKNKTDRKRDKQLGRAVASAIGLCTQIKNNGLDVKVLG